MFHDFPLKLVSMTTDKKLFLVNFVYEKKKKEKTKRERNFTRLFFFYFLVLRGDTVRYSSSTYGRATVIFEP